MTYRLAISGTGGIGKMSLAAELAQRLNVPLLPENLTEVVAAMGAMARALTHGVEARQAAMRHYLEVCEDWLKARVQAIRAHPDGFVADRWALDILVRWLYAGFRKGDDALYRHLVAHMRASASALDALVIPPLMPLAAGEDTNEAGLQRAQAWSRRLHVQAITQGLAEAWAPVPRLCLPRKPMTVQERASVVLQAVPGLRSSRRSGAKD